MVARREMCGVVCDIWERHSGLVECCSFSFVVARSSRKAQLLLRSGYIGPTLTDV
jgi:hypothetical protein